MIQMRNASVNLQNHGTAKQVLTRPFSGRRSSVDSDANNCSFYYDPKTHFVYERRDMNKEEPSSRTFTKVDYTTPIHINISRHHNLDATIPVKVGEPSKIPMFRRRSSFNVDGQPCPNASSTRLMRSAKVQHDSIHHRCHHSSGHNSDNRAGVRDISGNMEGIKEDDNHCCNVSYSAQSHAGNLGRRHFKNSLSQNRHQYSHHDAYYSTSKRRHNSHRLRASDLYKVEMINNFNNAVRETTKTSSRSIEVVNRSLVEEQNHLLTELEPSNQKEGSHSSSYYSKSLWDSDTSLLAVAGDFHDESFARKSNGSIPPIPPVLFLIDEVENVVNDKYVSKPESAPVDASVTKTHKDRRPGGFMNSIRKVMHPRGNNHRRHETNDHSSNRLQEPTYNYATNKSQTLGKKSMTKKKNTSSSSSPTTRPEEKVDSSLRAADRCRSRRNVLRQSAKSTPPDNKVRSRESLLRQSTHRKMASMEGKTVNKQSRKSTSKPAQKVNPFAFF